MKKHRVDQLPVVDKDDGYDHRNSFLSLHRL